MLLSTKLYLYSKSGRNLRSVRRGERPIKLYTGRVVVVAFDNREELRYPKTRMRTYVHKLARSAKTEGTCHDTPFARPGSQPPLQGLEFCVTIFPCAPIWAALGPRRHEGVQKRCRYLSDPPATAAGHPDVKENRDKAPLTRFLPPELGRGCPKGRRGAVTANSRVILGTEYLSTLYGNIVLQNSVKSIDSVTLK